MELWLSRTAQRIAKKHEKKKRQKSEKIGTTDHIHTSEGNTNLFSELAGQLKSSTLFTLQNDPSSMTYPSTISEKKEEKIEEPEEDDEEEDQLIEEHEDPKSDHEIVDSDHEDCEEDNQFYKDFPNLPRAYCPRNLFIYNLRPKYLNCLYKTSPRAFPNDWGHMKRRDPLEAWNALNTTVVAYMNSEYSDQGFALHNSGINVDQYSIYGLKKEITETITKAFDEHLIDRSDSKSDKVGASEKGLTSIEKEYRTVISQLKESIRLLNNEVTKMSNKDNYAKPQASFPVPTVLNQAVRESHSELLLSPPVYSTLDDDDGILFLG